MSKVFRCQDLGLDCNSEIRGSTEDEVLKQAVEHCKTVHGMTEVPPEVENSLKLAIREG
jgi:predicted small metal-binding protein